jgi:hypothetical protein
MKSYNITRIFTFIAATALFASCKKNDNPNNLPEVNTAQYEGKIDGYTSSDEIYPNNLVAYWSFDGTKNETKSNTAPTQTANDQLVAGGVRGQALSLNAGYLYFANQFNAFKTDVFKSFTISQWIQIFNNGSKRTMAFQLARPGIFNGSINFAINTQSFPASDLNNLKIQPTFTTIGGGTQDNINTLRDSPGMPNYMPYITPTLAPDRWIHLVITYNGTTGFFHLWINGVRAGAFPSRGTGNNLFKAYEPSEVIIGGNYNVIPGKSVNTDANFAAMTGKIDELRIYNIDLPDANIKALYNLGRASK